MTLGTTQPIRIELPTPFDVGSVNSYLFIEPEPILVDTGVDSPESWDTLTTGLAQHGVHVSDIRRIIITHPHVDHFGQAYKIVQQSAAQVHVANLGYDWLVQPRQKFQARSDYYRDVFLAEAGISPEMAQLVLAYLDGVSETVTPLPPQRVSTFAVDAWLPLGTASWQVLHMPGHASHQTCFYQPQTHQFLSADMLLAKTPTPIVERPFDGKTRQPALPRFMESLQRVAALEIDWVYPGHGAPFSEHRALIARQQARIQQRQAECLALIRDEGLDTAVDLTNRMYASYPPQFRFAGLWMLIGYLDLLQADGKINVDRRGRTIYYTVNERRGDRTL